MKQQFRPHRLFNGNRLIDNPVVTVENGIITAIDSSTQRPQVIELDGLLAPGFIDVQVNGGGGILFNNEPVLSTLIKMIEAHSLYGTTGLLPTVITDDITVMQQAADAVSQAVNRQIPGIIGIHFEGPHLSKPKKGVHPIEHIRAIGDAEWQIFNRTDLGVKMITLAPENVTEQDIQTLKSLGWIVNLGHSNADYDTAQAAVNAGADGFTHLFNAMSALTSREPGMVGAALLNEDTYCGIIIDHHHVHPQVAKLAYRQKTSDKLALVTDAMALIGSEETQFHLFGEAVRLKQDKLTISTGQLAGSHLSMLQAVQNCINDLKLPFEEVLKMASSTPANWINKADILGKIAVGSPANWVQLDDEFNLIETWINGQPRHCIYNGSI